MVKVVVVVEKEQQQQQGEEEEEEEEEERRTSPRRRRRPRLLLREKVRDAEECRSPSGSALQAASREVAVVPFAKATVDGDLRPVVNTVDSTSDGAPRHDMRVSQACF